MKPRRPTLAIIVGNRALQRTPSVTETAASMRAVLQRVSRARVVVADETVGAVERGLLVLLGVAPADTSADAAWLADKTVGLRIFADDEGKMNRSVAEVGGAVLGVGQFTLYGDCRKGRRPSFIEAAPPETAIPLYEAFVEAVRALGVPVATGRFQAMMPMGTSRLGLRASSACVDTESKPM